MEIVDQENVLKAVEEAVLRLAGKGNGSAIHLVAMEVLGRPISETALFFALGMLTAENRITATSGYSGRNAEQVIWRKTDPVYWNITLPERACDHCSQNYRGPAVYCSLECAMADA